MDGYAGKVLYVDLTTASTHEVDLDPTVARKYLGGRGLGARLLYDEVPAGTHPLSPANKLIFLSGPLAGTGLPGSTHYLVIAKSPLTGLYGEAHAGGAFGVQLKQAGYDVLVVEGQAAKPVYLWIHDGQVEIKDASPVWGLPTATAEDRVQELVGNPRATVATIGPAGENQVKIACIISEKTRVAARTGLGAVMGAKRLKAIAVYGSTAVPVADRQGIRQFSRTVVKRMQEDAFKMSIRKYGTATVVKTYDAGGILPTQNFRSGAFAGVEGLSGDTMAKAVVGTKACTGCPIGCVRLVHYDSSPLGPVDEAFGGPEYETIAALGSLWLNGDMAAVAKGHELCNAYGIDTISAGVIVAWVIECFERGILSASELDGLEPRWGDAGSALRLLEKICLKQGVGAMLGEGVRRAAATFGRGSDRFAMHVKGLEIPMHEPRGKKGLSISYATGPRGAAHTEMPQDPVFEKPDAAPEVGLTEPIGRFETRGKGAIMKVGNDVQSFVSAAPCCNFVLGVFRGPISLTEVVNAVNMATGWDATAAEMVRVGERANTLARLFNVREGAGRREDTLPARFAEPLEGGANAGQSISPAELELMVAEYYAARGWSSDGEPLEQTVFTLGL